MEILNLYNRRMNSSTMSSIRLPTIRHQKKHYVSLTCRLKGGQYEQTIDKQNQNTQIHQLDNWTARKSSADTKAKSKIINTLYRNSIVKKNLKTYQYAQSNVLTEAKLFLLRLQGQLKKINNIKYIDIYKNIEYCSGVYENFYSDILRQADKILIALNIRYNDLIACIQKQRSEHIKSLEKTSENDTYKLLISTVRESIEKKQLQLEPLKSAIQSIQISKVNILEHSLNNGYDVRNQGLIWIIRALGSFPSLDKFPNFLNDKEIKFLKNKFQSQKQKKKQLSSFSYHNYQEKTPQQIINIITRKKKRQLSMIKEGDILSHLQGKSMNPRNDY